MDPVSLALVLGALGAVGGTVALVRTFLPPATRLVNDLRAKVEELDRDVNDPDTGLHARYTKRTRKENMDGARTAHEERKARRDAVEQHALELVQQQQQGKAALPQDSEALRAHLRTIHLGKLPS